MRSSLPLAAAAAFLAAIAPLLVLLPSPAAAQAFICDIPTAGCKNGMFNQAACECECIPPFCPDDTGDCTIASDNCGGNKWKDCTRGVNCPWWVNPLKAESCFTGPTVPVGLWNIYNSREACCRTNFPYSNFCDVKPESTGPTKHPTIASVEDDVYEVIPIKFDVNGLPEEIKMRELKDEMKTVLKRILLRLAERIPGLKISEVEEKVVLSRALEEQLRALQKKDVSLYYNVYVIRDEDKKFGPIIIQEIRDSYDEVLDQVQTFADTKYFGADLNLNWCTSQNGKFELCVKEIIKKPPPRPARQPTVLVFEDPPVEKRGLPGWAIALIVIIVLLVLCCIAYGIYFACHHKDSVENNIYMNDKYSQDDDYYSRAESRRSRKSRRHLAIEAAPEEEEEEVQIVCAEPQDPQFDDESFSINTYSTSKKRIAKDPTMYIPGQENKPDPTSYVAGGAARQYMEDPPLKPKRDPTMYIENGGSDPSTYREGNYGGGDPPLKPQRDPTMYVPGQTDASVYTEREDASAFGSINASGHGYDDQYGGGYDDEVEYEEGYDEYGFQRSEMEGEYMTSETGAEYERGRRDPSYYDDPSYRTHSPKSSSKRSKKKKKSSRSR